MTILDIDLHKCEQCSGPYYEYKLEEDDTTLFACSQCGTTELEYYDEKEDREVYEHVVQYGTVYTQPVDGEQDLHLAYTFKPTEEHILELLDEFRITEIEYESVEIFAEINGNWMRYNLNGECIKSPLMKVVAHL